MVYKVVIPERTKEQIDACVFYILTQFRSEQAAKHLLKGVDYIISELSYNPYRFADSKDDFLKKRNYKEAPISDMRYKFVFRIENKTVYIVGFFHDTEKYWAKIDE